MYNMTDDSGHFTQPERCGLAVMPVVIKTACRQMMIESAHNSRSQLKNYSVLAKYDEHVWQTCPARFNAQKMFGIKHNICQSSAEKNVWQGIKMSIGASEVKENNRQPIHFIKRQMSYY